MSYNRSQPKSYNSLATVEDYESKREDGTKVMRKQLVIRFEDEARKPIFISFNRARAILKHLDDIQSFVDDQAYGRKS